MTRGGRPATGSAIWRADKAGVFRWHARVTMPDGSRPAIPLPPDVARDDPKRARALAAAISRRLRGGEAVPASVGETVSEWSERWLAHRELLFRSVPDDRSRLANHVLPHIGPLGMRDVSTANIEALVERLDARVRAQEIGWKTAAHAWTLVTGMFRDAVSSKQRDLRARADNPTTGVRGPDTGDEKSKTYLWPSEFLQLVSSPAVPLRWRRLFTLAVYTYARAGEIEALEWDDVHIDKGYVHVHKSVERISSRGRGKLKTTKTGVSRKPPMERELRPLLEALHEECGGTGHVFDMPSPGVLSRKLKFYLERAGVSRRELFITDATRKAITFHDLRATGITWMAFRGDDPLKIMQRAGHRGFETTQKYIREAENLAAECFGEVFPTLPLDLLGSGPRARGVSVGVSGSGAPWRTAQPDSPDSRWSRRGSNPAEDSSEMARNGSEMLDGQDGAETVPASSGTPQPEVGMAGDAVEEALAAAITAATAAGRFDVVGQLARELEARRVARAGNVVALPRRDRNRSS